MQRGFQQKDYYQTLGIEPDASPDEIKKAYRQLALQFHPDRNPGDREAEERFKEISEAYGVLIDASKRSAYETSFRRAQATGQPWDFAYSQEEILRDIFANANASEIFRELNHEFSRMGFRFDERFLDSLFFGGRGVFLGRIFFEGPDGFAFRSFGHPPGSSEYGKDFVFPDVDLHAMPRRLTWKERAFSWFWRKFFGFLFWLIQPSGSRSVPQENLDLTLPLLLKRQETAAETTKEVAVRRQGRIETLVVKIPAGVQDGTTLRLRGKGESKVGKVGDLYLKIQLK
jgi:curved DNA-binding protein